MYQMYRAVKGTGNGFLQEKKRRMRFSQSKTQKYIFGVINCENCKTKLAGSGNCRIYCVEIFKSETGFTNRSGL